ncbi:MAG: DUF3823 domain-containing protein [Candidatus Azobacteroides sp.]|nr:DUF3823 domain-containing protein [Candidatus Azobacteroides sp.]
MKHINYKLIFSLMIGVVLTSCIYDNYSPPSVQFSGRIVYQGEPVNVKSSSGHDVNNANVYFYLYEPGWQKSNMPIRVVVNQDGSFSSLLFSADYKMVIPAGVGPYITSTDTTEISISSNKTMDINVTPYYMVRNPGYTMSGGLVTAAFSIEKIITGAQAQDIQAVYLYINRLLITDDSNNIAFTELDGSSITDMNNMIMQVRMPDLSTLGLGISTDQKTIFARIGIQINNVNNMLYSPVQEITIN